MSEWTSRVKDHRIWALMESLGPSIDQAVQLEDIDPQSVEALERLRTVLAFCGKRLGGSDPLTVLPSALDAMAGAFESPKTEIDAFISDRNPVHLGSANSSADTALSHLSQVPGLATSEELIALNKAVSIYRVQVEERERSGSKARKSAAADILELTKALTEFRTQTQATISEIKTQIETERQKISTLASEQQKSFADAQEARGNTYSETLLKIQENLTKTLNDQQGQFSTAQENRNAQFTALQAEYTKKLAEQDADSAKKRDASLSALQTSYEERASIILHSIQKHKEDVQKLVGVIGESGLTSGYQKTADRARASMGLWNFITVAAMCGVILFGYYAFLPSIERDFRWESFAARVFLTITVGVLAAYAAAQADRFFHQEQVNRKMALELAAIDPFIVLLPEDEQHKFKLEIGRRSFAQEEGGSAKRDKSPATALDLLKSEPFKELIDLLNALAKVKSN